MAAQWTAEERDRALAAIVKRATTDHAFRALCMADASKAVQEVAGKPLPPGFRIRFVDAQGYDLTVVLPEVQAKGAELSDEELEQVAGGGRCAASCAASCIVTSTVTVGVPGVGGVACV